MSSVQFYCVKEKASKQVPRSAVTVDEKAMSKSKGSSQYKRVLLRAVCPSCSTKMTKFASLDSDGSIRPPASKKSRGSKGKKAKHGSDEHSFDEMSLPQFAGATGGDDHKAGCGCSKVGGAQRKRRSKSRSSKGKK